MNVYPVVHVSDPEQAAEQADLAFELGADGVFLIDHNTYDAEAVFASFNLVDQAENGLYIGVNLLGYTPARAVMEIATAVDEGRLQRAPDALWTDDMMATEDPFALYETLKRDHVLGPMEYLGGIAFKYTPEYTDDPEQAALLASRLESGADVVTTSGKGTGSPPPAGKIAAMKQVISRDLAVASGISLENIEDYEGIVDRVLVSSSVETEPYSGVFNPRKLRDFIAAAHTL